MAQANNIGTQIKDNGLFLNGNHASIKKHIAWSNLKIGSNVNLEKLKMDGRHIRIEVYNIPKEMTHDYHLFYKFLEQLPRKVDMNSLSPPIIVSGVPENPGLTGILIIDYSHISFHAFYDKNKISFDLYSCKDFDAEVVIKHAEKFFKTSREHMIIKEDLRF